ncbi:MAG: DUF2804 domain-containing protein [Eubacterium sp.]
MGTQHEVTTQQPLLNDKGMIIEPGWARQLIWNYNREKIAASWFRRKEWDYYMITDQHKGIALTLSDLGYIGMTSVTVLDFDNWIEHTKTIVEARPGGKYGLECHSGTNRCAIKHSKIHLSYQIEKNKRRIQCYFPKFWNGKDLEADIVLYQPPMDTMCIATPWKEKPTAFYYNQKINCMPASGFMKLGDETQHFYANNAMGVLDWGRGVWTYDNTWYWGTASGWHEGVAFGFNLGYGFSDRSSATENMVFYNNIAHKLDEVSFIIPENASGKRQFMKPWRMTSNDGRFEGFFIPKLDRSATVNLLAIKSIQHQIFGNFTGRVILDDGTILKIEKFLCAVEVIHNMY